MIVSSRLFAVIPAAGHSRRMGQPKLLLPLAGSTVMERLLAVLKSAAIAERLVVVRAEDADLKNAVWRGGGRVLSPPLDPPDMRASIDFALESIQREFAPRDDDGWLLVPADHPVLDRQLIESLLTAWERDRPLILAPRVGQQRGHPTLFRWSLAREVTGIPNGCGLNWLLQQHATDVLELPVEGDAAITDLDTPEDYQRLCRRYPAHDHG